MKIDVSNDHLQIGEVGITFHRTLRIPDDGNEYLLPPSLGSFPLRKVDDFKGKVPSDWETHGGIFFPMFQREAMWMSFNARQWKPNAIKVAIGKVNALSGETWSETLCERSGDQDYMVVPLQPWLDGINSGNGQIKQFVAMPLGIGYTVEGQVTGEEKFGGIQLCVYDPKPGKFPDNPPVPKYYYGASGQSMSSGVQAYSYDAATMDSYAATMDSYEPERLYSPLSLAGAEMGLAAGGKMRQKIYEDPHGIDTWDQSSSGRVYIHIVNSALFTEITGEPMPNTPVTVQSYAKAGYPWFDLYDEHEQDIDPSSVLKGVKSVKEKDFEHGFKGQQDDSSVHVPVHKVIKYGMKTTPAGNVRDGKW